MFTYSLYFFAKTDLGAKDNLWLQPSPTNKGGFMHNNTLIQIDNQIAQTMSKQMTLLTNHSLETKNKLNQQIREQI